MRIRLFSLVALLCVTIGNQANAQSTNGSWSDHLSYYNCVNLFQSAQSVYGIGASGIIKVDMSSGETQKLSKVNLLNDVDLSAFLPIGTGDDFIVGYSNGNIDIYLGGKLYNVPDIKEKTISGSKKINKFRNIGDYAYASTDFGIVVVDYKKREIKDTWKLGPDNSNIVCHDLIQYGDNFYVATSNGLYKAPMSSRLLSYYATWEFVTVSASECLSLSSLSGQLIAVFKINESCFDLKRFNNSNWYQISSYYDAFKNLSEYASSLLITTKNSVIDVSPAFVSEPLKSDTYNIDGKSRKVNLSASLVTTDGRLWVSDIESGLVQVNLGGNDIIYTPDSPLTNYCQDLEHSGKMLFVAPGIQTERWFKGWLPAQIYFYDGHWTNVTAEKSSLLKNDYDICSVSIDPTNTNKAYFTSWGNGLFETEGTEITQHYSPSNSPIISAGGSDFNYTYMGSARKTTDGVCFIANTSQGILAKIQDQFTVYSYKTFKEGWFGDLVFDQNGYGWTFVQRSDSGNGVLVFDTNNTPTDDSDDRYRGPQDFLTDDDARNIGQMKLIDQDGNIVSADIFSIAVDKNNYLWVGTNQGPLVNYRTWAVFSEDVPIFNRIKIPRNEGDNLADYLLEAETITKIVIDGANRKWLATRSSGAFLVSEDGTKTILSFNTSNSPLPSNSINSIAIDPLTGEVFFATDKGIVSYKGNATEGQDRYSNVYAYPNPVRPNYKGSITIKGLLANSNVKITDVNGNLVFETTSLGGQAIWDGRTLWGKEAASGVYLVMMADKTGVSSVATKILIVR